eukprot:PLAT8925.1.p1 GENE.PLAT8925.1~~PLAT8925.1.p1  ORF type:complete len:240 (+),score=47.71 PLAT8925.1:42-722(+)
MEAADVSLGPLALRRRKEGVLHACEAAERAAAEAKEEVLVAERVLAESESNLRHWHTRYTSLKLERQQAAFEGRPATRHDMELARLRDEIEAACGREHVMQQQLEADRAAQQFLDEQLKEMEASVAEASEKAERLRMQASADEKVKEMLAEAWAGLESSVTELTEALDKARSSREDALERVEAAEGVRTFLQRRLKEERELQATLAAMPSDSMFDDGTDAASGRYG